MDHIKRGRIMAKLLHAERKIVHLMPPDQPKQILGSRMGSP
jgi:hypothetical protein